MGDDGEAGSDKAASRRTTQGTTGRVTPRAAAPKGRSHKGKGAPASSRYTPPVPRSVKVSPRWVPILMFTLLGLGVALIILNYLGVLPGGSDNKYLLAGLASITAGFITATQYH